MGKQKMYQILRSLVGRVIPAKYRLVLVRWLISDKDTDVKNAALKEIWKTIGLHIDNSLQ